MDESSEAKCNTLSELAKISTLISTLDYYCKSGNFGIKIKFLSMTVSTKIEILIAKYLCIYMHLCPELANFYHPFTGCLH